MLIEEEFPQRLAELRTKKGVSARDMSLSIGQGPGYINNIENGHNLPSMSVLADEADVIAEIKVSHEAAQNKYVALYQVDDFRVADAKDSKSKDPGKLDLLYKKMKGLKTEKLEALEAIIDQMK